VPKNGEASIQVVIMNDRTKFFAEGLLKAIKAEREGYHFYQMAAQTSQDPLAKEVFSRFADEEREHAAYLHRHYQHVVKTGAADEAQPLGELLDEAASYPIFSDEIKGRISGAHFEMTALAIGIRLELDAIQFYKSQAAAVDDLVAKRFYSVLAEWESRHYHALLKQQDELKEEYWAAGGFAPF
jgi:rubrerythrin